MLLQISLSATICIIGYTLLGCETTPTDPISDSDTSSVKKTPLPTNKLGFIAGTEETDSGMNVRLLVGSIPQELPVVRINDHDVRMQREDGFLYWELPNVDTGASVLYTIEYRKSTLSGSFKMPRPMPEIHCNDTLCQNGMVVSVPTTDTLTFSWSDTTPTKYIYSYAYDGSDGPVRKWDVLTMDSLVSIVFTDTLLSPVEFTISRSDSKPLVGTRNPDVESEHAVVYHDIKGPRFSTEIRLEEPAAKRRFVTGKPRLEEHDASRLYSR